MTSAVNSPKDAMLDHSTKIISRLATENGRFRFLIAEAIAAMDHAQVFLCSREKMNDIGRVQWTELLNRMAAAIEGPEPIGNESAKLVVGE